MADSGRFLTFDLGAESGRAVLGTIDGGRLELDVVHRFPNEPQRVLHRFHWDTLRLFAEIKSGLARCVREKGADLDGIGIDTWGVDFALLDANDDLLGLPYHYRDHRTDGVVEKTFAIVPREDVYNATGIQVMQLNSLYQLMAMRLSGSPLLEQARTFLMTPDLLHFWLTGCKAVEFTNATTTQCYDPRAGDWARGMLDRLGIPHHFLGEIVPPGTRLGPLHPTVREETGAGDTMVIAPATHDTGSAVAAAPAEGDAGWAYISCGTWSLVGLEAPAPVITPKSLAYNLTNEGGVNGTFRLLRNVMGLWILQQCRRAWERAGSSYSYEELATLSASARPFAAIVDPDDPGFLNPPDMPAAIDAVCRRTGQQAPGGVAATVRCIVESLAMKYRWVIERLEDVSGKRIETVHLIGGGSQNRLLCQATADCTGLRVLAGPIEATAIGNVLVQAMAAGVVGDLRDARAMVRRSFSLIEYMPREVDAWAEPYARFTSTLV
ncbi:MAG TPA: rhamnulokinase family protein [Chthonomonadales bacterium]|nr:rhamnulokinase family protein [Chthonomonadales bacterium]